MARIPKPIPKPKVGATRRGSVRCGARNDWPTPANPRTMTQANDTASLVTPKLSVVSASYNRPNLVPSLLDDLSRQTILPGSFEVVVVDDGSTVPVRGVLEGRN